jgi:hypothetical protein
LHDPHISIPLLKIGTMYTIVTACSLFPKF